MRYRFVVVTILLVMSIVLIAYMLLPKKPALSSQNPEEEYEQAVYYVEHGRIEKGILIFDKIIQENPGTDIAATCHFELAGIYGFRLDDGARMLQEYQTIADEYRGTENGYLAESYLIDCHYGKESVPFDTWLEKKNDLILKYGGISVFEVLRSNDVNSHEWWEKIQSIPGEYRELAIPDEYRDIANNLEDMTVQRLDDSLKLHMFVRTYFPRFVGSAEEIENIYEIITRKKGITSKGFPHDNSPPTIRPIAPRDGNRIGDAHPKIEIELDDGDLSQTQIDLSKLIFTLDGEDLTDKMRVESHINTSGQLGPTFERIRIQYRPNEALVPGVHTVHIKAMDGKKQASEKTWSFTVK